MDATNHKPINAFVIAPLAPAITWAVVMANPFVLLFALPLAYFGMLTFGLPLYLLARRYWRVSLSSSVIGGAVSGGLVGVFISWWGWGNSFEVTSIWFLKGASLFAIFGVIAGVVFWLIYRAQQGAQNGPRYRAAL
jgi:hypothetical protein